MSEADVVLHVESFDANQMKRVQYSFSTKITDCLQSGNVLLAIGPAGISSIEYPRRVPGAMVIDDLHDLYDRLHILLSDEKDLVNRAKQIREYALDKHSVESVINKLRADFEHILL